MSLEDILDERYQLQTAPPTSFTVTLWNYVFGLIADRLTARETLEASFEALEAQGIQASLDYVQASIAPQLDALQTDIATAQDQIETIIEEGTAPNALKLGGELPAHYATAAGLSGHVADTENPHAVTKAQVGLGAADNTSDAAKAAEGPIGSALAARLRFDAAQVLTDAQKATLASNSYGPTMWSAVGRTCLNVNPVFDVSQEYGDTAVSANATHPVDNVALIRAGFTAAPSAQRVSSTFAGLRHSLQMTLPAEAVDAASDRIALTTGVEGSRCAPLGWATADRQPLTVVVAYRASAAGTKSFSIQRPTSAESYTVALPCTGGGALDFQVLTIPPPAANENWANDTSTGLIMMVTLRAGADHQVTANGAWEAGAKPLAVGHTNNGAVAETFTLDAVFLLPGVVTPTAEHLPMMAKPYEEQLRDCQRLFYMTNSGLIGVANTTTTAARLTARHPVPMRVAPVPSTGGLNIFAGGEGYISNITASYCTTEVAQFDGGAGAGLTVGEVAIVLPTTNFIKFDAR